MLYSIGTYIVLTIAASLNTICTGTSNLRLGFKPWYYWNFVCCSKTNREFNKVINFVFSASGSTKLINRLKRSSILFHSEKTVFCKTIKDWIPVRGSTYIHKVHYNYKFDLLKKHIKLNELSRADKCWLYKYANYSLVNQIFLI